MEKQYNLWPWPTDGGTDAWDVDRLIELSRELPVKHVPLDSIWQIDTPHWGDVTPRDLPDHYRSLRDTDLAYPIILSPDGRVMDGMHRVVKVRHRPGPARLRLDHVGSRRRFSWVSTVGTHRVRECDDLRRTRRVRDPPGANEYLRLASVVAKDVSPSDIPMQSHDDADDKLTSRSGTRDHSGLLRGTTESMCRGMPRAPFLRAGWPFPARLVRRAVPQLGRRAGRCEDRAAGHDLGNSRASGTLHCSKRSSTIVSRSFSCSTSPQRDRRFDQAFDRRGRRVNQRRPTDVDPTTSPARVKRL